MMEALGIKEGIPRLLVRVEMNSALKEQVLWSTVISSVVAVELNSKSVFEDQFSSF